MRALRKLPRQLADIGRCPATDFLNAAPPKIARLGTRPRVFTGQPGHWEPRRSINPGAQPLEFRCSGVRCGAPAGVSPL